MRDKFSICLDYLVKHAAEEDPGLWQGYFRPAAKVIGTGMLGMGTGFLAGAGMGKLLELASGQHAGEVARRVGPIAGTAAGLIYPMWQARMSDQIRKERDNVGQGARNEPGTGIPGQ